MAEVAATRSAPPTAQTVASAKGAGAFASLFNGSASLGAILYNDDYRPGAQQTTPLPPQNPGHPPRGERRR